MPTPEDIRRRIEGALPGAQVEVADTTGAGDHFEVKVYAKAFAGRTLIEQHQLVYGALDAIMPQIHALSVHTEAQETRS